MFLLIIFAPSMFSSSKVATHFETSSAKCERRDTFKSNLSNVLTSHVSLKILSSFGGQTTVHWISLASIASLH